MTAKALAKQADVERVVAGCVKGGMRVGTVRVSPDGTIEVYSPETSSAPRVNPLDEVLGNGS